MAKVKVLFVDDEPKVLEGLALHLRRHYQVEVATSGADGLEILRAQGPFAVVMSDMRMPGMDGVGFLARVREQAPDTVRMLLTGYADLSAAAAAVNQGQVFRFMTKPCPPDQLREAFAAAAAQHQLIRAERELLDNTLRGSVKVLTEILGLVSPTAFSRAGQIRRYVAGAAKHLGMDDRWQLEVAAMLAQIGCVALPPMTLDKVEAGQPMTADERGLYQRHPEIGHKLIAHIPRMEPVAELIRMQNRPSEVRDDGQRRRLELIRAAMAIDDLVRRGSSVPDAAERLREQQAFAPDLLTAVRDHHLGGAHTESRHVSVKELKPSMIPEQDICSTTGAVILRANSELNTVILARLHNFARIQGVIEPIRVRVYVENRNASAGDVDDSFFASKPQR